jgi:hypothetical protein
MKLWTQLIWLRIWQWQWLSAEPLASASIKDEFEKWKLYILRLLHALNEGDPDC